MAGSSGDESLPHPAGLDAVFKAYDVRGLVPEQHPSVVAAMRGHQAPWVVNVGRGIAEPTDDPEQWEAAVKAAAVFRS